MWQATVRRAPVALTVAKFGAVPGIVCSLDDTGVLSACYQGTDPPTSAVVAAERKDIDYDQINLEHRKLLQVGAMLDLTRGGSQRRRRTRVGWVVFREPRRVEAREAASIFNTGPFCDALSSALPLRSARRVLRRSSGGVRPTPRGH